MTLQYEQKVQLTSSDYETDEGLHAKGSTYLVVGFSTQARQRVGRNGIARQQAELVYSVACTITNEIIEVEEQDLKA